MDATAWPPLDIVGIADNEGILYYTLAFVVANPWTQVPSWGGYYDTSTGYMLPEIEQIRALGGDVIVSFGGAANSELAVAIQDVTALQAAYQSVIDTYSLTAIDFDIEGAWVAHPTSIARRSQAIAGLQAAALADHRELDTWFTLPVLPSGLTPDGIHVLQSAIDHGARIDGVNIMAMDYGDWAAPNPDGQMGEYAIQAAESLYQQLETLYLNAGEPKAPDALWAMIGVTPMIGLNDVVTETFYQQDAQELFDFAIQRNLGMLSMWSMNRDRMCSQGVVGWVSPACSSIAQTTHEFAQIFRPYTGDTAPTLSIAAISVDEGDDPASPLLVEVTLNPPASATVTVDFTTESETAFPGQDYFPASGSLTFSAGATSQSIPLQIVGDLFEESVESFRVLLSNPVHAELGAGEATVTIQDDDRLPAVSISDATVAEGTGGFTTTHLTVSLDLPVKSGQSLTVDFATSNGSAQAGFDYDAAVGSLTVPGGEATAQIDVSVIADADAEGDETFWVTLSNAMGGVLSDAVGLVTIEDDDSPAGVAVWQVTSDWGSGYVATFQITNTGDTPWQSWELQFDFPHEITSIWNAVIVEHTGDHFRLQSAGWNSTIQPGSVLYFGFMGYPGGVSSAPTNVTLDGDPLTVLDPYGPQAITPPLHSDPIASELISQQPRTAGPLELRLHREGEQFQIQWASTAGEQFRVEHAEHLKANAQWRHLAEIPGTSPITQFSITPSNTGAAFFRITSITNDPTAHE